jgi:hypothetical protein
VLDAHGAPGTDTSDCLQRRTAVIASCHATMVERHASIQHNPNKRRLQGWKVGTHMDVLSGGSRVEDPAGGMQNFHVFALAVR